ncbi:hypothetical protein ZWY2020_051148 [Hordeum vulgare]|nr:hypothetical protein ZWY2020_051148 [Hordeum vulgare]
MACGMATSYVASSCSAAAALRRSSSPLSRDLRESTSSCSGPPFRNEAHDEPTALPILAVSSGASSPAPLAAGTLQPRGP